MELPNSRANSIYWVNDNYNVLVMVKTLLEENGYPDVELFNNGQELLDRLKFAVPALIISDIHMPVVDGFQLIKALKSDPDPRVSHVPVILFSATFNDFETRRYAIELGASAFFNAPLDNAQFIEAVRKFTRPQQQQQQLFPPPAQASTASSPRAASRLLILEDDLFISRFLLHSLRGLDIAMKGVATVAEFRASFDSFEPTVCIIDYNLPDGNGIEVLRYIKGIRPDVKVILMTAVSNEGMIDEFVSAGADDFISKPINVRKLINAVQTAADTSSPRLSETRISSHFPNRDHSPELSDFFVNAPIALAIMDQDMVFTLCNSEFMNFVSRYSHGHASDRNGTVSASSIMDRDSLMRLRSLTEKFAGSVARTREIFTYRCIDPSGWVADVTLLVNAAVSPSNETRFRIALERITISSS